MKNYIILLIVLFAALYILPLEFRPLISPDETRYAEITREMIESSDYVAPQLNGVRYFEKPILGYWAFAGSMKIFGQNAFALRLPAALAAGLSALLILLLAHRFGGGGKIGLLAAGIYLTMPMVFIIGSVGILDGPFSFFVTATLFCYFMALHGSENKKIKILYLILTGVAAGAAFLTKGFLAYAIPGLVVLPYLIWQKRWKEILLSPWLPFAVSLLVIAPWAWAVHRAESDYWHYFVVVEHWNRFFGGEEAQHAKPFYFFLPILLGGAAQWFLLSPAIVKGLRRVGIHTDLMRYCICWALMPFLLFSCSSGKLESYILPCFAPLALIFAVGFYEYMRSAEPKKILNAVALILSILLFLALAALIGNHLYAFPFPSLYFKNEAWKWLILLTGGVLSMLAMFCVCVEKDKMKKISFFLVAFVPVIFCAHLILPERVMEGKAPGAHIVSVRGKLSDGVQLVSFRNCFQTVCWEYKRSDVWMLAAGEIAYGLNYPESKHRLLNRAAFNQLVTDSSDTGGVLLVMPTDRYREFKEKGFFLYEPEWEEHAYTDNGYSLVKWK